MKASRKLLFLLLLPLFLTSCLTQPPAVVENRGTYYYGEDGVSKYVIVQPGQSLLQIAVENNVSLTDLARTNKISPPYSVYAGQNLRLPNEFYHTVKPGETLYSIAGTYKVAFATLAKVNKINEPYTVKIGDKLRIPFSNRENAYDFITQETIYTDGEQPNEFQKTQDNLQEEELAPIATSEEQALDKDKNPEQQPDEKDAYNDAAFKDLEKNLTTNDNTTNAIAKDNTTSAAHSSSNPSTANAPASSPSSFKSASPLNSDDYAWPVKGEVVSRYGESSGKFAEGISISAPPNSPVAAASKGEVIYVGNDAEGYGKMVIIKHDNDILSAYAHNSSIAVQKGDVVTKGQTIARVGKTGEADTSQLYFSMRRGKATINPEQALSK